MIGEHDALRLPEGVSIGDGLLADRVRGSSWPLNGTGAFVLGCAGRPLGATVRDLAAAFALSPEAARADVLRFVWQLNGLALVNVERSGSRLRRLHDWLALAARLAPAGAVPATLARRRAIDTRSPLRGLASCLLATLPRMTLVSLVAFAVAVQLGAALGMTGLVDGVALALGTGAGVGMHEAGHAACLHGVPSALVTHGRRTYVLHAPVPAARRAAVAAAGPLVAAAVGTCLIAAGSAGASPELAAAGYPLAAHAAALTAVAGDGRVACGL